MVLEPSGARILTDMLPWNASHGRRLASAGDVVFGFVTDAKTVMQAAVVLQQLRDVGTALPAVVFNTSHLPADSLAAFDALGARVVSLEPRMPVADGLLPGHPAEPRQPAGMGEARAVGADRLPADHLL